MKFEAMMLRGLFLACVTVCGLILGAMLTATPPAQQLVGNGSNIPSVSAILLSAPTSCALLPDGVVCPQVRS